MASRRLFAALLTMAVLGLAGCAREPSAPQLKEEVQSLLESELRPGLLELISLRRLGSARFKDPDTGDRRVTVYFNAQLRFEQAFDLTAWDGINAASLAFLLGATEKGVTGVSPGGNAAGDVLRVHGSRIYALRQNEWRPLLSATTGVRSAVSDAEAQRLIGRLQELTDRTAERRGGEEQAIISDELSGAVSRIERKLDRYAALYATASGPRNGAYYRYAEALVQNPRALGVQVKNYTTQGSVENCRLVQAGSVDVAIAQSNLTAQALAGDGVFKSTGPLSGLRAVSALFPEYLQVVVATGSNITTLDDLAGKRIDFGLPESGSRVDALRLLDAAGLPLSEFADVQEAGLETAVSALRNGELDAFFTTQQAPARTLQELIGRGSARLLPIPLPVLEAVSRKHGIYRVTELAPHTYPGQREPVSTLGVTATLVVRSDFPDDRVDALLGGLYRSVAVLAQDNLRVTLLSRSRALEGLSIPLHPAAERFFETVNWGSKEAAEARTAPP